MFYMTGSLSYNISYYNISKNKDFKDGEGFKFSFSNRFDFFSPGSPYGDRKTNFLTKMKDVASVVFNKFNIFRFHFLSKKPDFTITNQSIIKNIVQNAFLIRRPRAILYVIPAKLDDDDKKELEKCAQLFRGFFRKAIVDCDINADEIFLQQVDQYILEETVKVFKDFSRVKRLFGKKPFNLYERSISPYVISLIASASRRNGGEVHSTYHGVCQTANEPDISTMIRCTYFWGITDAFADDARELIEALPKAVDRNKIRNMKLDYLVSGDLRDEKESPPIKRIAIIGRPLLMRYSAFNTLEFPVYLKFERDLARWLVARGYDVTYKAHPESDWRYFDTFLPDGVKVDWAPFEKVCHNYDAAFFHFGASSTMPNAISSSMHIFMLQDGWHDIHLWPTRMQEYFKEHFNMVPGRISQTEFISLDFKVFEELLLNPKPFSIKRRVEDFYYRRSFS
tara:strand:+ start:168353 stop:169708 length:1356 start_codon:yes stop_codon:yes gene_type:complete